MSEIEAITCEAARERWHARLEEGGTDPRLDRHLADCPACRTYAQQMERVLYGLGALREESEQLVVSDSRSSVPVLGATFAPRWLVEGMRLVRVAAALAFVVLGGWYFGWHLTGPARIPEPVHTQVTASESTGAGSATAFRLCGQTAEKYLAVPTPAPEPNVRVVWLYPVYESPNRD